MNVLGTLETTFHGQNLSVWSGDHWVGQKSLIFIRGTLTNGAKVASERQNVRTTFFLNSNILGTKWLRHQKWVLNWRFLRELNCKCFFEQVTPSRSLGKQGKVRRQISRFLEIGFGPPSAYFGSIWSSQKARILQHVQKTSKVRTSKVRTLYFDPRGEQWSFFGSDGMEWFLSTRTIDINGFSMVLLPFDHQH